MANELIGLVNKTTGAGVPDAKTIVKDGEITAASYANILSAADTTVQAVADRLNIHQHNVGTKALGLVTPHLADPAVADEAGAAAVLLADDASLMVWFRYVEVA